VNVESGVSRIVTGFRWSRVGGLVIRLKPDSTVGARPPLRLEPHAVDAQFLKVLEMISNGVP
jgi:hypothetical protein